MWFHGSFTATGTSARNTAIPYKVGVSILYTWILMFIELNQIEKEISYNKDKVA